LPSSHQRGQPSALEFLRRIAALEEIVAALNPPPLTTRQHTSSASSTPSKPETKKHEAAVVDGMVGVDETNPAPTPPLPEPLQKGTQDRRTPMENDG
jgi:hypothetical protein